MPLGTIIKSLREQRALSQAELARASGVSRGYLSQVESGQIKSPSVETVCQLAAVFGVTVESMVAGTLPTEPPKQVYKFKLTADERQHVETFIESLRTPQKPT